VSEADPSRLPTLAIATIGHHRHGKTTLVAAITRVLARRAGLDVRPCSVEQLDRRGGSPPLELFGDQLSARPGTYHGVPETLTVRGCSLRYATARRTFVQFDAPGRRPWLRNVARTLADADAALLVVSAPDSVQPQTIEHLRLARALGIRQLVVFLAKCDLVTDLEWLDLVERDVRDLLDRCGYEGDATRIVRGAALPVYSGADSPWEASVVDLVDVLETELAVPEHPTGGPLLYVDHVFSPRPGPRTLVEGRLRRGRIARGDFLWLLGPQTHRVGVTDLESYHRKLDLAVAGDQLGLLLAGVEAHQLHAGVALTNVDGPLVRELVARIELLPSADSGRRTPLRQGHSLTLIFGATHTTGTVLGPDIQPGAAGVVRIALDTPVFVLPHQRFAVRDGTQGPDWKQGQPARWAGLVGAGQIVAAP
jgi:elongation factor Tu